MRHSSGRRAALGLCVLGSALTLQSTSRAWTSRTLDHGPALPLEHITRTGQQLAPGLRPLALVGLAGVLGLLASHGWLRTLVANVLAFAGIGIVVVMLFQKERDGGTWWPYLAGVGGLMLMLGGLAAVRTGRSWGGMSDAYRTPAARASAAPVTDKGVWDALDRGEDPTADPHG